MCLYIQIYVHVYLYCILCESKCAHIRTCMCIYIIIYIFIYLFVHLLIPFPTTSLSHGPIGPMLNRWRDGSSIHSATGRPFFILRTGDHHAKKYPAKLLCLKQAVIGHSHSGHCSSAFSFFVPISRHFPLIVWSKHLWGIAMHKDLKNVVRVGPCMKSLLENLQVWIPFARF